MSEKSKPGWDAALTALVLAAPAVISVSVVIAADAMDEVAAKREVALVEQGMGARMAALEKAVLPQVLWDEAVEKLDNHFDPDWADQNVGQYFSATAGVKTAFVLDAANAARYAYVDGAISAPDAFTPFWSATHTLIDDVRTRELERGALKPNSDKSAIISSAIQSSAVRMVDGRLYIVSASLVQPDYGLFLPKSSRAPIVISARELDIPFMGNFARDYLLTDLHVHPGAAPNEPSEAHAVLRDKSGAAVATLDWTPQRPGAALLDHARPALAAIAVLFTLLAGFFFLRSRRAQSALRKSEADARYAANHDSLTGLPNRRSFAYFLTKALETPHAGVCVLNIDIDQFSVLNDTFGHAGGDEYIKAIAARLINVIGAHGMLARIAGDEFAVVLAPISPDDIDALGARLLRTIAEPVALDAGVAPSSASIGVSSIACAPMDAEELARQADLAVHRAKAAGRNRVVRFNPDMDAAQRSRNALAHELAAAIESGELDVVYQPQSDEFGNLLGVEALVRWPHKVRGEITPAYFVPLAEECGLIDKLGQFVIDRAFSEAQLWPELRVAINVSAAQLRAANFVRTLERSLRAHNAEAAQFEIEITESVMLDDDSATMDLLYGIKALGFSIALDDFGTGYSSLSYLHKFPIDKIKIDRTFVANIGQDNDAETLISAMIRLSRALKLNVIAEGVETHTQRRFLTQAGCAQVQGFLFGRPMRAEDLQRFRMKPAHVRKLHMHEAFATVAGDAPSALT